MGFLDKVFSGKPSKEDFAELVKRQLHDAGRPGFEYDEDNFSLKLPDKDSTLFLTNSYSNYCRAPRNRRREVVEKMVASFVGMPKVPDDFASAKPHLMPAVRDAAYNSLIQIQNDKQDTGLEWPCKTLAGELQVGLVYDSAHSITMINQNLLSTWGVGLEETLRIAKENLWERTDPRRLVGQGGVFWSDWGDSYDSSRLLLTELIYRLEVDGDPVACVPNRDALIVCGRNSAAGLEVILKAVAENHFGAHPLSPDLFVLEDGVWKPFYPDDSALYEMWQQSRQKRNALDHGQQKQMLDEMHEKKRIDVYVANYMLVSGEEGRTMSVCVWGKDVDTSLPRADTIAFVLDPEKKDSFMVPWDEAVSIIGALLEEEPGLIPRRFRARHFPDEEQISTLRTLGKQAPY